MQAVDAVSLMLMQLVSGHILQEIFTWKLLLEKDGEHQSGQVGNLSFVKGMDHKVLVIYVILFVYTL